MQYIAPNQLVPICSYCVTIRKITPEYNRVYVLKFQLRST